MYCKPKLVATFLALASILLPGFASSCFGQDETSEVTADTAKVSKALDRAIRSVAEEQLYQLKYQVDPGTTLIWDCEQSNSTRVRGAGTTETSSARTTWTSEWKTQSTDTTGNIVFETTVKEFSMWQQKDDKPPVVFESKSNSKVPDEMFTIADSLKPVPSRYTISKNGKVIHCESATNKNLVGFGDLTVAFPVDPIPIGFKWFIDREASAREKDQSRTTVALRVYYELTKVIDSRAYLTFRTEALTPRLSPSVKSQLMQDMPNGYVIFDLKRGMSVYRETVWNHTVQQFHGADSYLNYMARTVERLRPEAVQTVVVEPPKAAGETVVSVPAGDAAQANPLVPLPIKSADSATGDSSKGNGQ